MSSTAPPRLVSRKKIVAAVAALLVVSGGGAAFAYWSSTGAGTGSATTGTSGTVTVVQTSTVSNLRPGAAAQPLSGTFTNTTGANQYVTSVTASIGTITRAQGVQGECTAANYRINNPTMSVGLDIANGTSQGTWGGATIEFVNTAQNQDACRGAQVAITYTSN